MVRRERATSDERAGGVTIRLTDRGRDLQERAAGIPEVVAGCLVDDAAGYAAMKAQLTDLAARIALSRTDSTEGGGPGEEHGSHRAYAIPATQ